MNDSEALEEAAWEIASAMGMIREMSGDPRLAHGALMSLKIAARKIEAVRGRLTQ